MSSADFSLARENIGSMSPQPHEPTPVNSGQVVSSSLTTAPESSSTTTTTPNVMDQHQVMCQERAALLQSPLLQHMMIALLQSIPAMATDPVLLQATALQHLFTMQQMRSQPAHTLPVPQVPALATNPMTVQGSVCGISLPGQNPVHEVSTTTVSSSSSSSHVVNSAVSTTNAIVPTLERSNSIATETRLVTPFTDPETEDTWEKESDTKDEDIGSDIQNVDDEISNTSSKQKIVDEEEAAEKQLPKKKKKKKSKLKTSVTETPSSETMAPSVKPEIETNGETRDGSSTALGARTRYRLDSIESQKTTDEEDVKSSRTSDSIRPTGQREASAKLQTSDELHSGDLKDTTTVGAGPGTVGSPGVRSAMNALATYSLRGVSVGAPSMDWFDGTPTINRAQYEKARPTPVKDSSIPSVVPADTFMPGWCKNDTKPLRPAADPYPTSGIEKKHILDVLSNIPGRAETTTLKHKTDGGCILHEVRPDRKHPLLSSNSSVIVTPSLYKANYVSLDTSESSFPTLARNSPKKAALPKPPKPSISSEPAGPKLSFSSVVTPLLRKTLLLLISL